MDDESDEEMTRDELERLVEEHLEKNKEAYQKMGSVDNFEDG